MWQKTKNENLNYHFDVINETILSCMCLSFFLTFFLPMRAHFNRYDNVKDRTISDKLIKNLEHAKNNEIYVLINHWWTILKKVYRHHK